MIGIAYMFREPEPLPEGHWFSAFTPDAALGWLAAYAGPCTDCQGQHTQLYMLPVIGWLHVVRPNGDVDRPELRPAIMSTAGIVVDYLDVPAAYKLIGVVPADEDATTSAKEIYRQRFADGPALAHDPSTPAN